MWLEVWIPENPAGLVLRFHGCLHKVCTSMCKETFHSQTRSSEQEQEMRTRARPVILLILSGLLVLVTYNYLKTSSQLFGGSHQDELVEQNSFPMRSNLGVGEHRRSVEERESEVNDFRIRDPFTFPQPAFSRPAQILLRSQWVKDLQDYLGTLPKGTEVSVVTSSVEHTDVLLNWLIAAFVKLKDPLKTVMVISMDAKLHSTLVSRGISSLYVHKNMVVSPTADVPRVFSQVHVVRLAVVRLMNHYGYHVINYDCDAILLRNLQPVFDKYKSTDLIGTFGKGPDILYRKWGVALNTGVMVMRATENMGKSV